MAKKKVDFGKIKELLIAKGERAGLAVCLALGAGLLVLGVISGMSNSKKDWVTPFEQGAVKVRDAVARAEAEKKGEIQPIPIWRKGDRPLDIPDPSFIKFYEGGRRNRVMPRALPVIEASDPKKATKFPHSHGLTVLSEHKDAQVDYLLAGCRTYEINFDGEKYTRIGAGNQGRLSEAMQPHRLIVVQLAYNMKKQVREFAESLGITEKELLAEPTQWPHVMGMDIIKYELAPGAKQHRERKIYEFQPHETVATKMYKVEPKSLDRLFRSMVIETEQTGALNEHIFIGLVSPVPQLLTGPLDSKTTDRKNKQVRYPEVRLEGITSAKEGGLAPDAPPAPGKPFGPRMPKPGGSDGFSGVPRGGDRGNQMPGADGDNAPAGQPNDLPLAKLRDENGQLYFRVKGGYYPFDPNGEAPERRERGPGGPGAPAPGVPNMPGGPGMPGPPGLPGTGGKFGPKQGRGEDGRGEKGPAELAAPGHFETTRLIRFIDVEAQPGYSYVYGIQIYLANPFHGRKDAESLAWSKEKLLPKPSPLSFTPPVTVPGEFFYYTMDQDNPIAHLPRGNDTKPYDPDRVPVQLHRYLRVQEDAAKQHDISDWVIAERLLVRRGGIIGQRQFDPRSAAEKKSDPDYITVEAPEWDRTRGSNGAFWIYGEFKPDPRKKNQQVFRATGFQMAFGGRDQPRPVLVDFVGGRHLKADLSSAAEVLVLDADGKLILRNSNTDTADFDRRRRYDHWTTRIEQTRRQLQGEGAPGGPGMPAPGMPGPGAPKGG